MAHKSSILLVDDDERLGTAAGKVLTGEGYRVGLARSGREALAVLKLQGAALVVCDVRLPDLDGMALLKQIREFSPDAEVVMITGHGSIELAVAAMRLGAYDFIEKPLDRTALLRTVARALEKQRLASGHWPLRRQPVRRRGIEALLGDSPAMRAVKKVIRQIAPTNINVLIQGESGTGKEIVADALHELSDRHRQPLLKISCAAIPETLLESELFGHERGAFTGAAISKPGKLELAGGGTLFLDEIAEMSPHLQAKLLRVLQDGQFQRLGATRDIRGDFRLVCATHADVPRAIDEERFRADLYYRINTVQLVLPPLRERRGDVPLLADHFRRKFAAEMNKDIRAIEPRAHAQLLAHAWPGNVRELEHVIQRAVALAAGDTIRDVAFAPAAGRPALAAASIRDGAAVSIPIGTRADEATKRLVQATIEQCAGNKFQAARILGIPPRTMYRNFANLRPPSPAGQNGSAPSATVAVIRRAALPASPPFVSEPLPGPGISLPAAFCGTARARESRAP